MINFFYFFKYEEMLENLCAKINIPIQINTLIYLLFIRYNHYIVFNYFFR